MGLGHSHGGHSHGGGCGHSHAPADFGRAFAIGVALNTGFVIVEVVFGLLSGSLALLADAGHNLSDVAGLLLAWGAAVLARRPANPQRTYGFRRASILAALFNAVLLLVALGGIVWESVQRFSTPHPVAGGTVIAVAAVGIVINTATALLFMSGRKNDLNINGAFLHMAADAAVSLGVVLAGFAMQATHWNWLDPVVSLSIAAIIFGGTWSLLKDSLNLSLDAVPAGVVVNDVRAYLQALPGVTRVHDLHIWAMSTTETALTAHLVRDNALVDDALLEQAARELHDRFGIEHTTLQLETGEAAHTHRASCDEAMVRIS